MKPVQANGDHCLAPLALVGEGLGERGRPTSAAAAANDAAPSPQPSPANGERAQVSASLQQLRVARSAIDH